jgi:hypothetical protein
VAVERLTAGQVFHRTVQSAFLTGLAGASGFKERPWRLIRGRRGRVDLAVQVDGDEQMLVIIEIKGTDWNAVPADRVLRNLRRHLRQLQAGDGGRARLYDRLLVDSRHFRHRRYRLRDLAPPRTAGPAG